ncbi:MAG: lipid-A-disaccharide synthase [Candidatus Omnitrophica bacterium]|nr:lipid-A-disaccharide synthase [Candidatus Omnitrophota bacterium]
MEEKHIIIICGEPSGDLHAGNLVKEIKNLAPQIKISGVGGRFLEKAGAEIYQDIKELTVLGFFDVIKKLPKFLSLRRFILKKIEEGIDAIILVDYSGFNLRLAKKINKKIPVIYYISPQLWASRSGRIKTIKRYISKMLVFFKFEKEFYRKFAIEVDFIGHPLIDIVKPTMKKEDFLKQYNLSDSKITFALLPGSRIQEIRIILPLMLKTCLILTERLKDIQFIIAKSEQISLEVYQTIIKDFVSKLDLRIIEAKTYDCLNVADFCLVASGTTTLETAIMQKPFVIIYKMSLLNYLLYRPQIRVPFIGMVNIIAGRKIIPEFIQFQARPKKIAEEVISILKDPSLMISELARVKSLLGSPKAAQRAARIILDFLKEKPKDL